MLLLQLFLNHGDDAVLTLIDAPFVSTIKFELKCLFHIDYPVLLSKVSRVAWWMHHYLGPTPKRHYLYSNSPVVARLESLPIPETGVHRFHHQSWGSMTCVASVACLNSENE